MGVTCQILLDKPKEGFYRSGQAVTGAVKYYIDKQMEFVSINISLIGKGQCRWKEKHGKTTRKYHGEEDYVTLHNIIQETVRNGTTIYQQGYYEFRFNFVLPVDIPSTFKTHTGKISYQVMLKFEKPKSFKRYKTFESVITVQGLVSRTSPEPLFFGLHKKFLVLPSKNVVNIKAEANKTVVAPGESINLKITVNNESSVSVSGIKAELYEYTRYISNNGHKKKDSKFMKETTQELTTLKNDTEGIITCEVPSLLNMYSIQYSKIIEREYKLRLTLQLPFPYINAFTEVPIVVGHQTELHCGGNFSGYLPTGNWEQMDENRDEKIDVEKSDSEGESSSQTFK